MDSASSANRCAQYSPGCTANPSNKHRFVANPFALAVSHDAMTLQTARGLSDQGWFEDSPLRVGPSQRDILRFPEHWSAAWLIFTIFDCLGGIDQNSWQRHHASF